MTHRIKQSQHETEFTTHFCVWKTICACFIDNASKGIFRKRDIDLCDKCVIQNIVQLKTVIDSVIYTEIQDCHMLILFTQILCAGTKLPSDTSKTNSYILTWFQSVKVYLNNTSNVHFLNIKRIHEFMCQRNLICFNKCVILEVRLLCSCAALSGFIENVKDCFTYYNIAQDVICSIIQVVYC